MKRYDRYVKSIPDRYKLRLKLILLILFLALINLYSASAGDKVVWQGQHFKGTEFQSNKEQEFNFTVYDAPSGGNWCYSNTTKLTTGNFGQWRIEKSGIGTACSNSSADYYLEIHINNETQMPRRLLRSFDFIRKDVNEKLKNTLTISTDLEGSIGTSSLVLKNERSGPTAVTVLRLINEVEKFVTIALGSNLTSIGGVIGNQASLTYNGGNIFVFSSLNVPNIWRWRKTFSSSLKNTSFDNLMDLTPNGSLRLYHGNFDLNGSVNATGNITTTDIGFFGWLGSLTNRITKLWVKDIDVSRGINTTTITATNISAVQYIGNENGENKIGLTSSQFSVCKHFNVPTNTCTEWCKLEITGGIITNCK